MVFYHGLQRAVPAVVSYYGYKGWSSAVHALMCLEKSGMNAY